MESQYKSNIDGTPTADAKVANPRSIRSSEFFLRFLAMATTLTAAILMGTNKETETVPIVLIPGTSPLFLTVPAKMHYLSSFVFFVTVNAIAAAYSLFSLMAAIASGRDGKGLAVVITAVDLLMVALLSSGIGAAGAVGVLGYRGNKHVGWNKVCNVYGKFCRHVAGSVIVSLIGMVVFILLVSLSVLNLHRRSK